MTYSPDANSRGIYDNHVGALRIGTCTQWLKLPKKSHLTNFGLTDWSKIYENHALLKYACDQINSIQFPKTFIASITFLSCRRWSKWYSVIKKCILFLFYLQYWMYLNFLAKCIPQINKLWMTYSMFQYLLNHALLKYTIWQQIIKN